MTTMKRRLTVLLLAMAMVAAMSFSAFAGSMTQKKAIAKALDNAGLSRSKVTRLEAEYDDGNYEIEFVRKSNGAEYSYEISGSDGTILEKSVDYEIRHAKSGKKIGKAAARKKVASVSGIKLSRIKKGTCSYERSDGEWIYEVKFRSGGRKYEYDVLARNGRIAEYEWEVINR